jgi:hypothetical protein
VQLQGHHDIGILGFARRLWEGAARHRVAGQFILQANQQRIGGQLDLQ